MNNSNSTEPQPDVPTPKQDGVLAASLLIATVIAVVIGGLYLWRNKKIVGGGSSFRTSHFTPPPERAAFIAAKEKLDSSNPAHLEELKKMLMRRAIQAIPILLSLQNEGNSIERLYKRGMLTDDMHFKVKELKAFVDLEFQDVQFDADELVEGWGQHIWPQAMQFHQLIQKQAEERNPEKETDEDREAAAEEKKKVANEKKKRDKERDKERERARKAKGSAAEPSAEELAMDPEQRKALEAERIAQQLLEEEEREKSKKKGNKKK